VIMKKTVQTRSNRDEFKVSGLNSVHFPISTSGLICLKVEIRITVRYLNHLP